LKIPYSDVTGPMELEVPNAEVRDLLTWVIGTNQWKQYPELAHEKLIRFRKRAIEEGRKTPVAPAKES
jgi:hypothetical protein